MASNEQANDLQQISETVAWYFNGMYRSDGDLLRKAFSDTAMITGHTDGRFTEMDLDTFVEFAASQDSAQAAGEPFDMRIVALDVTGNAATVKVADHYIGRDFIDYLALLKKDGQWRIYNKLWHSGPLP